MLQVNGDKSALFQTEMLVPETPGEMYLRKTFYTLKNLVKPWKWKNFALSRNWFRYCGATPCLEYVANYKRRILC
jgi:hypothetical protein